MSAHNEIKCGCIIVISWFGSMNYPSHYLRLCSLLHQQWGVILARVGYGDLHLQGRVWGLHIHCTRVEYGVGKGTLYPLSWQVLHHIYLPLPFTLTHTLSLYPLNRQSIVCCKKLLLKNPANFLSSKRKSILKLFKDEIHYPVPTKRKRKR